MNIQKINYKNYKQHYSYHDFSITYNDIKDSLQERFNNWIALKEKIGAAIHWLWQELSTSYLGMNRLIEKSLYPNWMALTSNY